MDGWMDGLGEEPVATPINNATTHEAHDQVKCCSWNYSL